MTKVAVVAVFSLMVASMGFASQTATSNITVTATIDGTCLISANPLSFGTYDPIGANASADLTGTTTVSVTCTKSTDGTVTLGQGLHAHAGSSDAAPLRQMSDGGSNRLAYTLLQPDNSTGWGNTSGTGVLHHGDGTSTGLTVYGAVTQNQNMPAGSYSDTVVATITF